MSGTLETRTRLFIAAESGGFSVDPDATGAAYLPVRVISNSLGLLDDTKAILETEYNTGRNAMTPHELGNDGAKIGFDTPLLGLSAAAGATTAPPADDWLDTLLNCAFGANVSYSGMAVSSSASTTLTTAASTATSQDLLAVSDAAVNSAAMMWRRTTSSASPYTVNHSWEANPTNTGVSYGIKRWGPLSDPGGYTLTALFDLDGVPYVCTGGRVTSLKLKMQAGQMAKLSWAVSFDTKTQTTRASLPAFSAWTGTPIKGQLARVEWGSTAYACEAVDIDFALAASDSQSVAGTNGRANIEVLKSNPMVTVTPLFAATPWEVDGRAGTTRNVMIRFGTGALSGGVVNSCAFWGEVGQIKAWKTKKDGVRLRQNAEIMVRDAGIFSGTTAARLWQFGRA